MQGQSGSGRRVAIIGAGPGGMCMGIKLKEAGYEDFVILEKGSTVGGTWYHNRYPGAACDIASHLYSYSFEMKPDWSRPFGTQPEILRLPPALRREVRAALPPSASTPPSQPDVLGRGVPGLADPHRGRRGDRGRRRRQRHRHVLRPLLPRDRRARPLRAARSFHSARWDYDHDLAGERVGVIGSAASAVQFVPEIAKQAGQLHLFQRTANWVLPKDDDPYDAETLEQFRQDPSLVREHRMKIWRDVERLRHVPDPDGRRGAERAGLRNLDAGAGPRGAGQAHADPLLRLQAPADLQRLLPHVQPAQRRAGDRADRGGDPQRRPHGRRPASARSTRSSWPPGSTSHRYLSSLDVTGRGGVHINEAWADGAQAYMGMTTAGFPNLFMLYGPNTNGGSSMILMLELEVAYIMRQLRRMDDEGLASLEVRRDVMERYNDEPPGRHREDRRLARRLQQLLPRESGRIVTQYPHPSAVFRDATNRSDPDAFLDPARPRPRGPLSRAPPLRCAARSSSPRTSSPRWPD